MTETVLVTGGSGLLGTGLVRRLQHDGWRVRAFVHRRSVVDADEEQHGNLLDAVACEEAAHGCEAIVHAAGVTHARRARTYWAANFAPTKTLVEAAERVGVRRLIFVSSRTAVTAGGWYGASKLAAERVVAQASIEWTIVRLPEIYGAGSGSGVDTIIERARAGRPVLLPGSGESHLCPMHFEDAIRSCTAALRSERAVGKTYVLGGECLTLREFAERCIDLAASSSRIVTIPWPLVHAAAATGRLFGPVFPDQVARLRSPKPTPSPSASEDLSVTARPLDDGLRSVLGGRRDP